MTTMADTILVICPEEELNTTYAFLAGLPQVVAYLSPAQAVATGLVIEDDVCLVILDGLRLDSRVREMFLALQERPSHPPVFFVWDPVNMLPPECLASVYYIIRKPFAPDKLLENIHTALATGAGREKRREMRLPVNVPVELYFDDQYWMTLTTNLSLHGMQAVWPNRKLWEHIAERFQNNQDAVPHCLLHAGRTPGRSLKIDVSLRYLRNQEDENLMGFEFRNIDIESLTQLNLLLAS